MNHWVDSVFDSMSEDERIAQLFMVAADPTTDTRNMQRLMSFVQEMKVGGVLFHKGEPETQAQVTNKIQKASRVPLFIALDGEWGLSMRLSGTTRFPKNMMLGAIEDNRLLEEYGREVGRQCHEMGIQINFAPDMDVNVNMDNPVIGIRSFGENASEVAEKGIAYAEGIEGERVISVAKHFPGHGDTSEDSHLTLPSIRQSKDRLEKVELVPFKRYVNEGFAGVMTAHLYVPALDDTKTRPASFSPAIVTDLLQKQMGFEGLCFTDALAMKGATTGKSDDPCVLALLAGNDILLEPASPKKDLQAIKEALDAGILTMQSIEARCLKILRYKYITGLNDYTPIQIKGLSDRLNSPHAEWIASKLNSEAITLLQNDNDYLPLHNLDQKIAVLSIGALDNNEFQKAAALYDKVDFFSIGMSTTTAQIRQIYAKLADYDLIICGVHTVRIPESAQLQQLADKKDVVLSFFTLPYFGAEYKKTIKNAKAVIMAYEGTRLAENFAAQAIFGGIGTKGKLPVSISGLYSAGTGLFTEKTRLGYHEPEEVGLNAMRLNRIDDIVREGIYAHAYPGCQVLVAKDGMIVYNKSFGMHEYGADAAAVTGNSVYDLASCSKASGTLISVMKSYDRKQFTLNSKISEFIPQLKGSNKQDITIRELLFHQSGLTPSITFYTDAIDKSSYTGKLISPVKDTLHPVKFDDDAYVQTGFTYLPQYVSTVSKPGFTREVSRNFYVSDSFQNVILDDIRKSPLSNRGRYVYSDLNFILLRWMVENQLKVPMDELLHDEFTSKLGAYHTTYLPLKIMDTMQIVPTENDVYVRRQLLRGYVHDEAAAFQGGVSGNAGLFTNANDLAKLLQLYLNLGVYGGERYLSDQTCRLFTQMKSPNSRRGLGFDKPVVGNPNASPCGDLAPASVYGHTGYTGTCFWVDPDNHIVYIFLSNRVNPTRANNKLSELSIRGRIQDAIYKAIDRRSGK